MHSTNSVELRTFEHWLRRMMAFPQEASAGRQLCDVRQGVEQGTAKQREEPAAGSGIVGLSVEELSAACERFSCAVRERFLVAAEEMAPLVLAAKTKREAKVLIDTVISSALNDIAHGWEPPEYLRKRAQGERRHSGPE